MGMFGRLIAMRQIGIPLVIVNQDDQVLVLDRPRDMLRLNLIWRGNTTLIHEG